MPPGASSRRRFVAAAIAMLAFVLVAAGLVHGRPRPAAAAHRGRRRRGRRPRLAARPAAADLLRADQATARTPTARIRSRSPACAIASIGVASGARCSSRSSRRRRRPPPSIRYLRTKAQPVEDRAGNQAAVQAFTQGRREPGRAAASAPPPPPPPASDRDGDGVPDAQDCGPADAAIKPGAADAPDLAFVDSNCDGIDGTETKARVRLAAGQGHERRARRRRRCARCRPRSCRPRSRTRTSMPRPASTTASSSPTPSASTAATAPTRGRARSRR